MGRPKKITETTEEVNPGIVDELRVDAQNMCYYCGKANPSIRSARGNKFCSLACQSNAKQ